MSKYQYTKIKLADGKEIGFDPCNAESVLDALSQLAALPQSNISSIVSKFDELKLAWRQDVDAGKTTQSLEDWIDARPRSADERPKFVPRNIEVMGVKLGAGHE